MGTYDVAYLEDDVYQIKQRIWSNLEGFEQWKQAGNGPMMQDGSWLSLADNRSSIALYSPYWEFVWEASEDIEKLQLIYAHKGREVTRIFDIPLQRSNEQSYSWKYEVHLWRETLFNGQNEYVLEASYANGRVITRKIILDVAYERISIWDTNIYLDSSYIPANETQDILWAASDFEGEETNFMTYGCDPDQPAPPILIQRAFQYSHIPACLTFSLEKEYMLWFKFKEYVGDSYTYDIISPQEGILYGGYPLFVVDMHTSFYNLVFFDPIKNRLKSLSARGDDLSYVLEIVFYDLSLKRELVSISHVDGAQLIVENEKEKILLYMYKQRDNYKSLTFPGMRYQFWFRWKQINQWPMYDLPLRIYAPQRRYWPTFTFDISLDDTILYIDDGIKKMSFDTLLIGKTIEVEDVEHTLNQSEICSSIDVHIYQNTRGDDTSDARASDTLRMVGKWVHASNIDIYHHESKKTVAVEQLFQWRFHYRMNPEKGTLLPGENTYSIDVRNARGTRICRLQKTIVVQ